MKKFLALLLLAATAFADGPIQNAQISGVTDVQSSVLSTTGDLTNSNACISSLGSTSGLFTGAYVFDHTNSSYVPSGTTIAGLPGSCSAGQVQMSNNATHAATGDTIYFGGNPLTQVPDDSKVMVKANGIDDTLQNAIANGQIGASGSGQGIELLTNPGFESGGVTQGWSSTGGTVSAITSGVDLMFGKTTAAFLASGSGQIFESAAIPIAGLSGGGCEASIYYLYAGSSGDYSLIAYDGTNVLGTLSLPPNSVASTPVAVNFPCGGATTSTLQLQVKSNVASPSTIYVDNAHLGSNGVFQVSQAKELGSVTITACAASFSTTSTTYADFGTEASCVYTTTGAALAPATNIPAIKFASIPAGTIAIDYEGGVEQATQGHIAYFQFTDGTTTADETSTVQTATGGSLVVPGIHQTIRYTTAQSNVTFKLQAKTDSGGTAEVTGGTAVPGTIRVRFYPASSDGVFTPANAAASWSGYQGPCNFTVTSATYADYANGAGGCTLTERKNRNFGTVTPYGGTGVSAKPGIVFTPAKTGRWFVCAGFGQTGSGTAGTLLNTEMTDSNSNVINAGTATTFSSASSSSMTTICGIEDIPSIAPITIKLLGQSATGTNNISVSGDVEWSITQLDYSQPAPVLPGSVLSGAAGISKHFWATVAAKCTSSPCTITQGDGSITGVTRVTTGQYVATVGANVCSVIPTCVFGIYDGNSLTHSDIISPTSAVGTLSSTSLPLVAGYPNGTGGLVQDDANFNITCDCVR